jgi:hypothetical protein
MYYSKLSLSLLAAIVCVQAVPLSSLGSVRKVKYARVVVHSQVLSEAEDVLQCGGDERF